MPILGHLEFVPIVLRKITGKIWKKWPFQIFCNNFSQKDWYKFEMAKRAIPNFFQQFFLERVPQIWNGQKWSFQIFSNNFSQKWPFQNFSNNFFQKRLVQIQKGQKWLFQIFSDNFFKFIQTFLV